MRRVLLALTGLFLLAGCDTLPERVLVPVPVACQVDVPPEPMWATADLKTPATIWEQVRALLAERRQRIAYENQLRVALDACRSLPRADTLKP